MGRNLLRPIHHHPTCLHYVARVDQATKETTMNLDDLPLFRAQDPPTSRAGAGDVRLRLGSQQAQLLAVYAAEPNGLTDEQAGDLSGLSANRSCCYWKRCSELRHKGFLRDTGRTTEASSGSLQMVCEITKAGLAEWDRLRMEQARKAAK